MTASRPQFSLYTSPTFKAAPVVDNGVSPMDRAVARALPDAYIRLTTTPVRRVIALVNRFWGTRPCAERVQLAHVLLIILASADDPRRDDLRNECENAVCEWLDRATAA
jgi:hypothetical protein